MISDGTVSHRWLIEPWRVKVLRKKWHLVELLMSHVLRHFSPVLCAGFLQDDKPPFMEKMKLIFGPKGREGHEVDFWFCPEIHQSYYFVTDGGPHELPILVTMLILRHVAKIEIRSDGMVLSPAREREVLDGEINVLFKLKPGEMWEDAVDWMNKHLPINAHCFLSHGKAYGRFEIKTMWVDDPMEWVARVEETLRQQQRSAEEALFQEMK